MNRPLISTVMFCMVLGFGCGQNTKTNEIPVVLVSNADEVISCEKAFEIVKNIEKNKSVTSAQLVNAALSKVSFCEAEKRRGKSDFVVGKPDPNGTGVYFFDTLNSEDLEKINSACMDIATAAGTITEDVRALVFVAATGTHTCASLMQGLVEDNQSVIATPTLVPIMTGVDQALHKLTGKDPELRKVPSKYWGEVRVAAKTALDDYENALKAVSQGKIPKKKPPTTVTEAQIRKLDELRRKWGL